MILSIFIRDKEFHISTEAYGEVHKVTETRGMADKIPALFNELLSSIEFDVADTVVYSSGPASFTTTRIINSIIKGIKVARSDIKFKGVSNFLTYMNIIHSEQPLGTIAIPTMRGDYYICKYRNNIIEKIYISNQLEKQTLLDSGIGRDDINLAIEQINVISSELTSNNIKYITNDIEINYMFNPEYVYKKA